MAPQLHRVLVTGLSGFVGQHILKMQQDLLSEYSVTVIADDPTCDLCNKELVEARVAEADPDWVIHLAAQSKVPLAFQDPESTLQVNVFGTLNLLQALDKYKFCGRMLYVSSGDVYGATPENQLPISETQCPKPGNPYAVSKVAAEALCMQWGLKADYDILVARPFNHIGPNQHTDFVVPSIAKQLVAMNDPAEIMVGDIDVTRDFLDVRDVIHAYFSLLARGNSQKVYNVSSGSERKIRELADILVRLSGKQASFIRDQSRLRPVDQKRVCGSAEALRQDTGWVPRYSLERTLRDIIQSFQNTTSQSV